MNEQRLHAYNQLIQTLLSCPSGEEPEILAANTELLDADFVQVVVAAAEHFAQQGEENNAEWLRNLVTYLTPETTPITQEEIDTYGQFLIEILQATAESNGDAKAIYPLLAANTDKLNDIFAESLRDWATNTLAEAYEWLLNLLCSYHKILYIYQKARQRYREAREVYSNLENKIQEFNSLISKNQTQLSGLKSLMGEIPKKSFDYTRCLQDLQTHHTAITTNITNYTICLEKIQTIDSGNSPQSWQDFINKDCKKWQQQIQTDINYLTPGQELFGQFVDTIRGIVETEQTERDRSLENTIQILGIGFGGGAIASGVFTTHIDKINLPIVQKHPLYASLLLSVLFTFFFIGIGWLITQRQYHLTDKK